MSLSKNVTRWLVLVAALVSLPAQAVLKIDITEGIEGAVPIAVVPFRWVGGEMPKNAEVSAIVRSDLARSGQFAPLPVKDLIARPASPDNIDFKTWRIAGMDHLVIGSVKLLPGNLYQVQFRLFDVLKAEQSLGYSFNVKASQLRSTAHRISDYIVEHLTGLAPAFDSRITYVTTQQQTLPPSKQGARAGVRTVYKLQVADTDGFNPQTLLSSPEPIMSPSWSPDGKQLVYVSFESGRPEVYIHNIFTGMRQKLTAFNGLNSAPKWSPDGQYIAVTLSKDGNPDIYIMRLADKSLRRLTRHWGIDTEASWMPDSRSLVFTSSRSGKPQIYRIAIKPGSRPIRLTFEGNYNANATVSPDGKSIAFVHGEGNTFRIASLQLDNRYLQVLTNGPQDESPEYAPNGSMILYAAQSKGRAVLAAVSADGRHKQKLVLEEGDVREPAWAPVQQ